MNVTFLGSGNLATHVALALKNVGEIIVQVYSPNIAHATELAEKVGAEPVSKLSELKQVDVYISAVKDNAQESVWKELRSIDCIAKTSLMFHTSGSIGLDEVEKYYTHSAVFYPLQSFSKDRVVDLSDAPFLIDASDKETEGIALSLASKVSSNVSIMDSEKRKVVHLAAVFASNFANNMYSIAADVLDKYDIPFNILAPLIRETAAKIAVMNPVDAQTGPAVRGDKNIMNAHLSRLEANYADIYSLVSNNIERMRDENNIKKKKR